VKRTPIERRTPLRKLNPERRGVSLTVAAAELAGGAS
jgi:hypothetical protein